MGIGYRGGIGSREKGKDGKVEQEVRREERGKGGLKGRVELKS